MEAKKKYTKLLWGVCGLSTLSTIVVGVSLYSERWIVSNGVLYDCNRTSADINYGLFSGKVAHVSWLTPGGEYIIKIACLFEKNACVWSCLETSEERVIELEKLYRDSSVIFTCTPVGWKSSSNKNHMDNTLKKTSQVHDIHEAEDDNDDDIKEHFINASLWVTVVVSMFISLAIGVVSTLITFYNIHYSAIQTVFMIQSLFIWYSAASLGLLLPFTLWGIEYYTKLSVNIATTETIMGTLDMGNRAVLGGSYWTLMVSLAGFIGCIMVLRYRQSLFEVKPQFVYPVQSNSSNLSISHIY